MRTTKKEKSSYLRFVQLDRFVSKEGSPGPGSLWLAFVSVPDTLSFSSVISTLELDSGLTSSGILILRVNPDISLSGLFNKEASSADKVLSLVMICRMVPWFLLRPSNPSQSWRIDFDSYNRKQSGEGGGCSSCRLKCERRRMGGGIFK